MSGCAFSPDGTVAVSGADDASDCTLRLWPTAVTKETLRLFNDGFKFRVQALFVEWAVAGMPAPLLLRIIQAAAVGEALHLHVCSRWWRSIVRPVTASPGVSARRGGFARRVCARVCGRACGGLLRLGGLGGLRVAGSGLGVAGCGLRLPPARRRAQQPEGAHQGGLHELTQVVWGRGSGQPAAGGGGRGGGGGARAHAQAGAVGGLKAVGQAVAVLVRPTTPVTAGSSVQVDEAPCPWFVWGPLPRRVVVWAASSDGDRLLRGR